MDQKRWTWTRPRKMKPPNNSLGAPRCQHPVAEAGFNVSRADRSISVDHREARGAEDKNGWTETG